MPRGINWELIYKPNGEQDYKLVPITTLNQAVKLARQWCINTSCGHTEVRASEYRRNLTGDNREIHFDKNSDGSITKTEH